MRRKKKIRSLEELREWERERKARYRVKRREKLIEVDSKKMDEIALKDPVIREGRKIET